MWRDLLPLSERYARLQETVDLRTKWNVNRYAYMGKKAVVVGSGIAGLAGAIRLACKGYTVEVFEANPYLGGKLTVIEQAGYRFDAGPSLFTMPHFVEELFSLAGKQMSDYFSYVQWPTACHYFFEDGTFLPFVFDQEALEKNVSETLSVDPKPLRDHLKRSKFIYDKTKEPFLENSLHRASNYFTKAIVSCVAAIPKLSIFTTMHAANQKALNHPKLVQIFDRYATYNGSNPYKAPGILNIIPHLEHGIGTFFPTKGMHSIPQSLIALGKDLGIRYHTNQRVTEILHCDNRVSGIKIGNQIVYADVVLCNSDVKPAYKHLLPTVKISPKVLKQEPSSSALIFYWGIRQSFPKLDLHNIFFSEDYAAEFAHIFEKKTVFDDPTIYVHISSKVIPSDAPNGCENWFVMVNVPANSGQNWTELRAQTRKRILEKLTRMLQVDIESLIETEDFLDPIRIEERTSSFAGALYGASSNERMAAFFRHPNFSTIKGLLFAGGSVHPGGGIPLCLLSAKIAVDQVS